MNELRPKKSSRALLGGAIGLPIGVCLFVPLYVFTFAAGTEIAAYVFPFAVIANPRFYDPWWLTLLRRFDTISNLWRCLWFCVGAKTLGPLGCRRWFIHNAHYRFSWRNITVECVP
jgi:hypothetical protein